MNTRSSHLSGISADKDALRCSCIALSLVVIFLHGIGKVGKSHKAAAAEAEAQKVPDEETGSTRTMTGVQDVKDGPA